MQQNGLETREGAEGIGHPGCWGGAHEQQELAAAVYRELTRLATRVAQKRSWQPFVIVGRDGRVLAGNRPLLELLGCGEPDILGTMWDAVMPSWRDVVGRWNAEPCGLGLHPCRFTTALHLPVGAARGNTVVDSTTAVCAVSLRDDGEPVAFTFLLSPV